MRSERLLQASFAAAMLVVAACAEAPTTIPVNLHADANIVSLTSPELEVFALCKVGPAGTYTFSLNASHPVLWNTATNAYDLSSTTYAITVNPGSTIDVGGTVQGACATFTSPDAATHNHIAIAGGSVDATITVVETGIPAGIAFDHVVTYQNTGGAVSTSSSPFNSAAGKLGGDGTEAGKTGSTVVFYNVAVPVYYGNSITISTVRVYPALSGGVVTGFTGSFNISAFDKAVTVSSLSFRISKNGENGGWTGTCTTAPPAPFNVAKSTTVTVQIPATCLVGAGSPSFAKGDDVRLEVIATLATGRVFSNSGFYKVP